MNTYIIIYNKYFVFFIWIVFINIFANMVRISQARLLINSWYFASHESLVYKYILSMFMRFINWFAFPVQELPITNTVYGWSDIWGQLRLCYFMSALLTSSKLIIFLILYRFEWSFFQAIKNNFSNKAIVKHLNITIFTQQYNKGNWHWVKTNYHFVDNKAKSKTQ